MDKVSFTRAQVLERLRKTIAEARPILGAGCSTGLVAKCAEIGGADLIIAYSTGRSRHLGLPTTQIGHSNPITLSMYDELSNVVDNTPIIGGIEAVDLTYRRLPKLLKAFREAGFDGLINFPTVGNNAEFIRTRTHVGQGFDREVEMIRLAREQDYFTMAYVWNIEQARQMAAVGVDVQVPHAGWTIGGMTGAGKAALGLEAGAEAVQKMIDVTKRENPECICLAHGGPFAGPEDTVYLYEHTDALGFVGASSIERIPIEKAVTDVVVAFKAQHPRASDTK